ncbi:MAG: type II secretion system F family protein [Candidatus Pacebacteria bacterium]|jgi:type IV pilus assembly protein PilC|nr:type II secretion system F family protein [Candidatus Paceibacterota bacterium]
MLFNYSAVDQQGQPKQGSIDALNMDIALASLQRRGFVVSKIVPVGENGGVLNINISFLDRVSNKDVVILSRQMATLFQAQVSALRIFRLLGEEADNKVLRKKLIIIADDIQGGSSISAALEKHKEIFSDFYISMVKAGEESGKLDETFNFLADYLDRTYELITKAKGALVYPAFVVFTFISVMVVMFTVVIPKISGILKDSGQELPIYTKIVMGISDFLVRYGFFAAGGAVIIGFLLFRYVQTPAGRELFDRFKLAVPYISSLYKKLYLSRLADNMNTMLMSGISMVRAIELTSSVIDNTIYKKILGAAVEAVKAGKPVSEALGGHPDIIPKIMIQMMKVGEETGELGNILKTLANFYSREVRNAVDALVDLIEPLMIVMLGLGVAILLASVLVPIYNLSAAQ